MKLKKGQKVWVLYVNVTSYYISFKIEEGKWLGNAPKSLMFDESKFANVVEHYDDEVNYVSSDDIFTSEQDALKALIKMLEKKTAV